MNLRFLTIIFSLFILIFTINAPLYSQSTDSPKYEFRGVWVATVANLDWPKTVTVDGGRFQRDALREMFDAFQEAGINAILFQVRTEGDAFYDSNYEPWSKFLTGTEGVAPDPYYDPLEFAIQEAHKRGMELHAWVNPYRAIRALSKKTKAIDFTPFDDLSFEEQAIISAKLTDPSVDAIQDYGRHADHVSSKHPEWILEIGSIGIINPGIPDAMKYVVDVVMDIVNRYNVDGVHFDDYFYPYSPNVISDEDAETYQTYGGDFNNIGDWRRNNINTLVKSVHDSMKTVKPHVKFGISPFGRHSEGYNTLYADAYAWLDGQYIDYINPQLYWESSHIYAGTAFQYLYDTWYAKRNDRHMYAGHGLYRASNSTFSGGLFKETEIPKQIKHVRANGVNTGSVFFRALNISLYSSGNIKHKMETDIYRYAALPPVMDWLSDAIPPAPTNLTISISQDQENKDLVELTWTTPEYENGNDSTLKYVIYRVESTNGEPDPDSVKTKGYYQVGLTGLNTFTDIAPTSESDVYYFVTTANSNSVESSPSNIINAGVLTTVDRLGDELPTEIELHQNYPNPFNPTTTIRFSLPAKEGVTIEVYSILSEKIATIVKDGQFSAGNHSLTFDASTLSSGIYFYTLKTNSIHLIKKMTLIK